MVVEPGTGWGFDGTVSSIEQSYSGTETARVSVRSDDSNAPVYASFTMPLREAQGFYVGMRVTATIIRA